VVRRPRINPASGEAEGRPGLYERVEDYVRSHHTLSLATMGHRYQDAEEEPLPHAATVFYAADHSLRLVFLSSEASRHAEHVAKVSAVAGTITGEHKDWKEIQGVQFWGEAGVLGGRVKVAALSVYVRRFPFVKGLLSKWKSGGKMRDLEVYRIQLERVAFTDNTTGLFGREILELGRDSQKRE